MRYAVLTAKHHDGFCLWDSQASGFTSMQICGRDLVREFTDACRADGLRVGLYLSVKDWSVDAYFRGPGEAGWQACVERFHAHAIELCSRYGQIDLLWFDCPDDCNFLGGFGERTADVWRSRELLERLRQLQPGLVINNRSGAGGDFSTPEQEVPAATPPGNFFESCHTTTLRQWGWCPTDGRRTTEEFLRDLVFASARGGNLLLNVGPDTRGRVPWDIAGRLLELGAWLRRNGEAVFSARCELPPWWDFTSTGRITSNGDIAWAVVQQWPADNELRLAQLANQVRRAVLLDDGSELPVRREGRTTIITLPDWPLSPLGAVVRLEIDGPVQAQRFAVHGREVGIG
jgi:alpha-L-fucosidase